MSLLLPIRQEVFKIYLKLLIEYGMRGLFIRQNVWLALIESFLFERQQRVILTVQESSYQTWCGFGFNFLVNYFF